MANTYSSLFYHAVFSTKLRRGWIARRSKIGLAIGGIAAESIARRSRSAGSKILHALWWFRQNTRRAEVVMKLKASSSQFIHEEFRNLRSFGWQDGFGIFSVAVRKLSVHSEPKFITRL
ncbi:MAG: transposase [Acidobacteria bacterium]|nr:transposase [Acidobacteriota bacterium]